MKRIIAIAALALSTFGLSGCFFFPSNTDPHYPPPVECKWLSTPMGPAYQVCE